MPGGGCFDRSARGKGGNWLVPFRTLPELSTSIEKTMLPGTSKDLLSSLQAGSFVACVMRIWIPVRQAR